MIFLPGLEPDFWIRQELKFINGVLDLNQFDKIFISVSGGKDSHAMLFYVKEIAEKQNALDKLMVLYADTGMEWHNAEEQVRKLCKVANIPLTVVYPTMPLIERMKMKYKKTKAQNDVNKWMFAPSSRCRYCTQSQKIEPLTKEIRKHKGILLNVTGERWEESKTRSEYSEFWVVKKNQNSKRRIYVWRPMLPYTTEDIWAMIKNSGVERHVAYDMGCARLGCAGCIFSTRNDLRIEMRENPHIFEELDRLETESGHAISMKAIRLRELIK